MQGRVRYPTFSASQLLGRRLPIQRHAFVLAFVAFFGDFGGPAGVPLNHSGATLLLPHAGQSFTSTISLGRAVPRQGNLERFSALELARGESGQARKGYCKHCGQSSGCLFGEVDFLCIGIVSSKAT